MTDSASPTDQPDSSEDLPPLVEEGAGESAGDGNDPDETPLLPDPGAPEI